MSLTTIGIIVGAELRAWRNRLTRGRTGRTAVLVIFLGIGATVFGAALFGLAYAASQLLPYARDSMLVGAFTALSVLMLVVGFPTVISTFFVGSDLIQLVLAPIEPLEIFLARSLLAMRANLLLGFLIGVFVFGVGAGAEASAVFYLAAVVLVLIQVLMVTAAQAVLISFVLRWVPARLARDVSVLVASVAGASLYLLWNVSIRQAFNRPGRPDVSGVVALAQHVDWTPTAWPGHALSAVIDGSAGQAVVWVALTVAVTTVLIAAAGLLYGRTLLAGLGQLGGVQSRWRSRTPRTERARQTGAVSPEMAIARKDWLVYRRDIRRLGRLLPALIFLVAYGFVLRPPRGVGAFWGEVFIVAFISMFMSMAVATSAIPSERRGFQLLRLAPVSISEVLRAKILYTLSPVVLLIVAFSVAVALGGHSDLSDVGVLGLLALWLSVGFVAIGVSVGGIDPRFDAADERRMVGPAGTMAGLAAEIGFGALSVLGLVLLRFAADVVRGGSSFGDLPASPAWAVAYVVVALVLVSGGVGVVGLMLRVAATRLREFEATIATA